MVSNMLLYYNTHSFNSIYTNGAQNKLSKIQCIIPYVT